MKKIFKVELEGDVLEKFLKIKRSVGLKKDNKVLVQNSFAVFGMHF